MQRSLVVTEKNVSHLVKSTVRRGVSVVDIPVTHDALNDVVYCLSRR